MGGVGIVPVKWNPARGVGWEACDDDEAEGWAVATFADYEVDQFQSVHDTEEDAKAALEEFE